MTLRRKYLKILSAIVPAGAVGASLLLGSVASGTAKEDPARWQRPASGEARVADKLAAIRLAVSDVSGTGRETRRDGQQLAWWANWRNGGGFGAWRNGGWRNGGWRNGWPNFWRNW